MTATINVNLKPCPISAAHAHGSDSTCAGAPILLPCPVPPSVTFQVVLGACKCHVVERPHVESGCWRHDTDCPARPVSVSCSTSGRTWEESEVTEVDWQTRNERGDWNPSPMSQQERDAALAACRARWNTVVKLLLIFGVRWEGLDRIKSERDAVYAALADMARAEETRVVARRKACSAIDPSGYLTDSTHAEASRIQPESTSVLAIYVGHLIESVSMLS